MEGSGVCDVGAGEVVGLPRPATGSLKLSVLGIRDTERPTTRPMNTRRATAITCRLRRLVGPP